MEQTVWCFTHSDLDGMTAGALVRERYKYCNINVTNYGRSRNLFKIKPGDLVFVTDFTLTLDEFQRLSMKGARIIWIDHHEANYKEIENQGFTCEGIRRNDYCGAALTWLYLNPNMPPEAMPDAIKLVNDYDLWTFRDPRTKAFSYGSGLWDIRPGNPAGDQFWNDIFSNDPTKFNLVLKYGSHIQKYVELLQDTYCKDLAYYTSIPTPEGTKSVLALSIRGGNSSVFDRMNKDGLDAVFTGQYVANIGRYRCSMYSPDNIKPILPIVTMFGGGGHPNAAGFQADDYPLPKPNLKEHRSIEEVVKWYEELEAIRQGSCILRQWIDRSDSITMKANSFHTQLANMDAVAVNHPYLPSMMNISSTSSDSINHDTSLPAKMYFSWVMENTGWYRCCATPSDTSTTLDELKTAISQNSPDAAQSMTVVGAYLWWYQRDMPVRPPIKPPEEQRGGMRRF